MDPSTGSGSQEDELLVVSAERLRWRAPELALVLARRVLAPVDRVEAGPLRHRANGLLVASLVHLGRHAEAVRPAIGTLIAAETDGLSDVAAQLRVDVAASSRSIGVPGAGFALLRPVLETGVAPAVRAGALAEGVSCLAHFGRRDEFDEALSEADRLFAADERLEPDTRRLLRAMLCARTAAYRRRHGDFSGAVAAVTEGMTLLTGLAVPDAEAGQARARLSLELVTALLDQNETDSASHHAEAAVAVPARATSAAAIGRLMLATAVRVMLPSGRVDQGHAWLGDCVRLAERHELEQLAADGLTTLTYVHELLGDPIAALDTLRRARAAEFRHLRAVAEARMALVEQLRVGSRVPDDALDVLRAAVNAPLHETTPQPRFPVTSEPAPMSVDPWAPVPTDAPQAQPETAGPADPSWVQETVAEREIQTGPPSPPAAAGILASTDRDAATGLLNRQGLRRRLDAARRQARPTALTLVRLAPTEPPPGEATPQPPPTWSTGEADIAAERDPDSTDRFARDWIDAVERAGVVAPGGDPAGQPQEIDATVFSSLAGHVRGMAPERAELARSEDGELAVLLPDTTKDEAEQFAAEVRESVTASDWLTDDPDHGLSVSTGVAQYTEGTSEDALLVAAREAFVGTGTDDVPHQPEPAVGDGGFDNDDRFEAYTYFEEYVTSRESASPQEEPRAHRHQRVAEDPTEVYSTGFALSPSPGDRPPEENRPEPDTSHYGAAATGGGRHGAGQVGTEGLSVLERLGIAGGGGGRRRRRAREGGDADPGGRGAQDGVAGLSIPEVPEPDEVPKVPEPPDIPPVPERDLPRPQPEVPMPPGHEPVPPSEEPEPAQPVVPEREPDAPTELAGRPARGRRRKREVGLADLLAEALVAYQSTTSEGSAAEALLAYDDPDAGQRRRSNPAS